jgi:hypothetical protein
MDLKIILGKPPPMCDIKKIGLAMVKDVKF